MFSILYRLGNNRSYGHLSQQLTKPSTKELTKIRNDIALQNGREDDFVKVIVVDAKDKVVGSCPTLSKEDRLLITKYMNYEVK